MKQYKRKLIFFIVYVCVCVYFGTNNYFHFLHFSHTSKRKCVQLKLTTKCTNLKLKQTYEFSFLAWGSRISDAFGFFFV